MKNTPKKKTKKPAIKTLKSVSSALFKAEKEILDYLYIKQDEMEKFVSMYKQHLNSLDSRRCLTYRQLVLHTKQ